jgi:Lipid A 3-O-deacylase (PagL)
MKRFYLLLLFISTFSFCQKTNETTAVEINYMAGNVLQHAPDLTQLLGHPEGVMVSLSKKTFGKQEWQQAYNNPDYGVYFLYQDFKNQYMGHNLAVGAHYNFYFLKRRLMFKVAQGIGYASSPFNKEFNNKNKAFGSEILANTNFLIEYKKENLIGNIGVQAGFFFTHFSNGRIKAPNSGINTYGMNLGLNYNFNKNPEYIRDTTAVKINYEEPIKYNFVLRTGISESPVINSGQYPFYHLGFFVDKRLNRKSALQLGTEVFLTQSVKDFIKYYATAYPKKNVDLETDYKRIGVFIGHELIINKLSLEVQLGYYVYQPFKYEIPVYDRVGAKYYITKNISTGISIKTHGFLAEALEFGTAIRL